MEAQTPHAAGHIPDSPRRLVWCAVGRVKIRTNVGPKLNTVIGGEYQAFTPLMRQVSQPKESAVRLVKGTLVTGSRAAQTIKPDRFVGPSRIME